MSMGIKCRKLWANIWVKLRLKSCRFGYCPWHLISRGVLRQDKATTRRWAWTKGGLGRSTWKSLERWCWRGQEAFPQDKRERTWLSKGSKLWRSWILIFFFPKALHTPGSPRTWWPVAFPQRARKILSFPKFDAFVGCTPPHVHTHCQPARCWTEAEGEADQVTNFHSDSC